MALPNFLIIGAQKAGTSSLYRYLQSHPQVFMSKIKEPKFFAMQNGGFGFNAPIRLPKTVAAISDQTEYEELFAPAQSYTAIGEASTWYLNSPTAASKIKKFVPDMKIIAILRHPVERAYSSYNHNVRIGIEPIQEFSAAVRAEKDRYQSNWGYPWYYVRNGLYASHLERHLAEFDAAQIRLYRMKQLREKPYQLLSDIFNFLGVNPDFKPDISKRYNVSSKSTRSETLHNFLNQPHSLKSVIRPLIPQSIRRKIKYLLQRQNSVQVEFKQDIQSELLNVYRQDIHKLQAYMNTDLSDWLE